MKIFSQYSIIMSDKKIIEDSPTQNPLRFLPKRKPKTHSVIRPIYLLAQVKTLTFDSGHLRIQVHRRHTQILHQGVHNM